MRDRTAVAARPVQAGPTAGMNHVPCGDEVDQSTWPRHNLGGRAIGDPPIANRAVGEAVRRGGLADVAAHLADQQGRPELRASTRSGPRLDRFHVTPAVLPAVRDYWTADTGGYSDHDMICMRIDLDHVHASGTRSDEFPAD